MFAVCNHIQLCFAWKWWLALTLAFSQHTPGPAWPSACIRPTRL